MKRQFFALAIFTVLTGSGVYAQTELQAAIPFDFAVGKSAMPAGDYRLTCSSNGVIAFREVAGKHSVMTLTKPTLSAAPGPARADAGKLVFQRYGNEYFLSGIYLPSRSEGLAVPAGVRQKELAARAAEPQVTAIAMRK
jgi:hypothetical protein